MEIFLRLYKSFFILASGFLTEFLTLPRYVANLKIVNSAQCRKNIQFTKDGKSSLHLKKNPPANITSRFCKPAWVCQTAFLKPLAHGTLGFSKAAREWQIIFLNPPENLE
jgi:hypothetical protein